VNEARGQAGWQADQTFDDEAFQKQRLAERQRIGYAR
jgi:hypothetical protein